MVNSNNWTYGAEHELSDWDTQNPLPMKCYRTPDYTIVNSNGIAAQPNPKVYRYGGEINTPPTGDISGQVGILEGILNECDVAINHRSNLHVHVRVPGLKENLKLLKQVQSYIHNNLPKLLPHIEPIPKGVTLAERKREKRRKVSHHTFLTPQRLAKQLEAKTAQEFFEREVPLSKSGQVMWHAQPRCCINLRQLLQTDTIEFRHFPGTLDPDKLQTCLDFCKEFLYYAINDFTGVGFVSKFPAKGFPTFPKFNLELEVGYQATASNNGIKQDEIKRNISLIESGKFNNSETYQTAIRKANGE